MRALERPRVAVIGSGLAGLTSAYLLVKEGWEVFLIEKSEKLGFHSSSVEIPVPTDGDTEKRKNRDGAAKWVVDVPMRSFQGGYYPLLIALYEHLEIPLEPTHFTFSFSHLIHSGQPQSETSSPESSTYFVYNGASGRSTPSLPSKFLNSPSGILRGLWAFVYMSICYMLILFIAFLSWHNLLPGSLGSPTATLYTLLDYIHPIPYKRFVYDILVPIFSAVGTMTSLDVMTTPLPAVLDYIHTTIGTPHYKLGNGNSAASVAARLVKPVIAQGEGHLRLGADITDMRRLGDQLEIVIGEEILLVDKVVIATQASAALSLLGMLQKSLSGEDRKGVLKLREALTEVEYRETIVVTHRDHKILPNKADRRIINLTLPVIHESSYPARNKPTDGSNTPSLCSSSSSQTSSHPPTPSGDGFPATPYFRPFRASIYTMGTHVIPPPAHLRTSGIEDVLQTTNPVMPINPDSVLAIAKLERALPLRNSTTLSRLRSDSAGQQFVHVIGSYAYPGIPLLEGCVGSAKLAVEKIVSRPDGQRQADLRGAVGGVDWSSGQGSWISRLWRYKTS